jgi:hypothetical protein
LLMMTMMTTPVWTPTVWCGQHISPQRLLLQLPLIVAGASASKSLVMWTGVC